MKSKHPTVTVGFVARERFSLAAKALRVLYKHTDIPFRLIIVDCNIPTRYRKQMERAVKGQTNVTFLDIDREILPNHAKNMVYEASGDDYICFLENDCVVPDGWLSKLIDACESFPAQVASPLLFDRAPWKGKIHHAWKLGSIKVEHDSVMERIRLVPHGGDAYTWHKRLEPFQADLIESHCVLYHRRAFEKIYPLPEDLSVDEFVDSSIALYKLGIAMIIVPSVKISFYSPSCVQKEELPFFRFRWDTDKAAKSMAYLTTKWNIVNVGKSDAFSKERLEYYTSFTKHWIYRLKGAWQRRVIRPLELLTRRFA